jgi:hypothetical protein
MKVLRPCVVWYSSTKKGRVKVLLDSVSGQGDVQLDRSLVAPAVWRLAPRADFVKPLSPRSSVRVA